MLPYNQKNVTDTALCGKENTTKKIILDKTVIFLKIIEKKAMQNISF